MGYTFTIGNAVPVANKDSFPELSVRWIVEGVTNDDAPSFPGDEMTGKSNMRSPSYSVWHEFCKTTGVYEFFYNSQGRLHASHPGCIGITEEDADFVSEALSVYKEKATLPAGFEEEWGYEGPPNYDYHLARLIWLEYWMQWAVKHCETPAISNT